MFRLQSQFIVYFVFSVFVFYCWSERGDRPEAAARVHLVTVQGCLAGMLKEFTFANRTKSLRRAVSDLHNMSSVVYFCTGLFARVCIDFFEIDIFNGGRVLLPFQVVNLLCE